MSSPVPDVRDLVAVEDYVGDDDEETVAGADLLRGCAEFLASHGWCDRVLAGYVGLVIPPVLGVALFEIAPVRGADPWIWVVGGDLPLAYMEFDSVDTPTAVATLVRYTELMDDWADAVTSGGSLDSVYPVEAAPITTNAELLRKRTAFIRDVVIPNYQPPDP